MIRRKNKTMTLSHFSESYPELRQDGPLGFGPVYQRTDLKLTKDEWIELMESFKKLTFLERKDLLCNDRT